MTVRTPQIVFLIVLFAVSAAAEDEPERPSLLQKGRYSLGLSGGFSNASVSVGAGFGYFVIDRLQPSVGLGYTWFGDDAFTTHQLKTSLELRYYFIETDVVSPFVFVDGAHVYLAYRGAVDEDHNFFYAGGGGGILLVIGRSVGLTLGIGVGAYLNEDEVLVQRNVLPDGVAVSGRFGLDVLF